MPKKTFLTIADQVTSEENLPRFMIGRKKIGRGQPCFIVAEIGINYDGEREKAMEMIEIAAEAGCDAVKFQIFKSERMYAQHAGQLVTATGKKVDIQKLIKKMELPVAWLKQLKEFAEKKGVEFFSSVCDQVSADILASVDTSAFKIASYEITHLPLIRHVSNQGKPLIMSCGAATISEIAEAIQTAQQAGQNKIVMMHCIAQYDVPLKAINLNALKTLQLQFPEVLIGYSDHTADPIKAPVTAVVLGAKMVEKHITLDHNLPGPDHSFALEPDQLRTMVQAVRDTETALKLGQPIEIETQLLGTSKKEPYECERYVRNFAYRLIYATSEIESGQRLTKKNMAVLRSGENYKKYLATGLHSRYYQILIDHRATAKRKIKVGQAVTWRDIVS